MREMKDSGVDWMGEIPISWSVIQNKYILSGLYSGGTPSTSDASFYDVEGTPFVTIADMSKKDYVTHTKTGLTQIGIEDKRLIVFEKGTVLYSIYATVGEVSELSIPACINQAILALIPEETKYNKDFYKYNLAAMKSFVLGESNGNTQFNLNAGKVKQFSFVLPSLDEQKRLADYLDSKCSQIDSIIEKQEAIIEKLKEYKLSVITEAVTKGLDPNVEMKDSGSVWFGSIPVNWEMKKLKFVFRIKKEIAGKEGYTVLSITQRGIVPKDFSNNEGQFANSYANYQLVSCGDFAMNHMDLLTGWVDISKYDGVTSPDYRVFVLDDTTNNDPNYYLYLMQMCYSERIFYGLGAGVSGLGRWRLQADKFLNFLIPVPSKSEQTQIAQYISNRTESVERSILERQRIIEKLVEFKKSLIYEVVTGKKEI